MGFFFLFKLFRCILKSTQALVLRIGDKQSSYFGSYLPLFKDAVNKASAISGLFCQKSEASSAPAFTTAIIHVFLFQ